jgi:hypothetical protein
MISLVPSRSNILKYYILVPEPRLSFTEGRCGGNKAHRCFPLNKATADSPNPGFKKLTINQGGPQNLITSNELTDPKCHLNG